jgi:hypothetical protein
MSALSRLLAYFAALILGIALVGASAVFAVSQIERVGLRVDVEGER